MGLSAFDDEQTGQVRRRFSGEAGLSENASRERQVGRFRPNLAGARISEDLSTALNVVYERLEALSTFGAGVIATPLLEVFGELSQIARAAIERVELYDELFAVHETTLDELTKTRALYEATAETLGEHREITAQIVAQRDEARRDARGAWRLITAFEELLGEESRAGKLPRGTGGRLMRAAGKRADLRAADDLEIVESGSQY